MSSLSRGFWQLADPKIWVASTVPMVVALAFTLSARRPGGMLFFFLSVLAVYCVEIAKNALNEVVDYLSGADRFVDEAHRTPFSGGKKTIVSGLLTTKQAGIIAVVCYGLCGVIGLVILIFHDFTLIVPGMLGVVLSILYSLPPFRFCYRGLGEVTVGLTFGPVLMAGIAMVVSGELPNSVIFSSAGIGFLIANVLWINEYPDYEADLAANKRNGVVRMGKQRAWFVHGLLYLLAYLSFAAAAILLHPGFLLPLITAPLAIRGVLNAKENFDDIPKLLDSNKTMIMVYQATGLLLIGAAVLSHFLPM